jgi:iron complex transport system substrate-binding protein
MRIVSLLSSATEILFALGLGDQVVAISHECDYPPEAIKLPRATRSLVDSSRPSHEIDEQVKRLSAAGAALYEIDRALIRELAPDLIVTQAQCDVCAVRYQDVIDFVKAEPRLARTNVVVLQPNSLDDVLNDIVEVGRAAKVREATVAAYVERLRDRRLLMEAALGKLPEEYRPRVAVVEWTEPLMMAGNWTPELVEVVGGKSVLAVAGEASGYVTWEELVRARPEVLIVAPCGFNLERSMVEARRLVELPGFQELPAVKQGRAFVVDGNAYLNRSGPRLFDSLEILAHLIWPDVFEPPVEELMEGRAWAQLIA